MNVFKNHFRIIFSGKRNLIIGLIVTGIFASVMEGVGLGLILPLLEGVKNQTNTTIPFPFNQISAFFGGMGIIQRVRWVALFLVIVTTLKGIGLYLNNIFICRMQMVVMKYFRMKCFQQIMNVGMSYINKQKSAYLQTIGVTHTYVVGAFVNLAGGLVTQVFTIAVLMVMLVMLSWQMTIVSLLIVLVSSVLLRKISTSAEKAGKILSESMKEINRAMLDSLLGMKVIRLFRRENYMTMKFEEEVENMNKSLVELVKTRGSVKPLFETLGVASLALILLLGSFILLSGSNKLGLEVILAFILIFFRVLTPALALNQARVSIKGDLPYYREVVRFLETDDKPYLQNGTRLINGLSESIKFCNVEFGYNPEESIVLREVSFNIPKGAKVGIVGPSGCGKSTIVELLLRFYDPQNGNIVIDGVDLKNIDLYSWRKRVGVVSQDTFLFHDTIRTNIAFAKLDATQEEIERAAKQAYAHEFIQQLPQGYDTLVGDRGVLLSGGQRQRIAIARAIVMNPDILVFDEATSSLDTESEEIVQRALYEVSRDKTVIAIAHRISTVFDSDIILVMENGKVIQKGRHRELLGQEGLYRRLIQMQSMDKDKQDVEYAA